MSKFGGMDVLTEKKEIRQMHEAAGAEICLSLELERLI